jgi:hypothetical protein
LFKSVKFLKSASHNFELMITLVLLHKHFLEKVWNQLF